MHIFDIYEFSMILWLHDLRFNISFPILRKILILATFDQLILMYTSCF